MSAKSLDLALQRVAQYRAVLLGGLFSLQLLLVGVLAVTAPASLGELRGGLPLAATVGAVVLAAHLLEAFAARRAVREGRLLSATTRRLGLAASALVPSLIVRLDALHLAPRAAALAMPAMNLHYVVLALSTVYLDAEACLLTGVVAALGLGVQVALYTVPSTGSDPFGTQVSAARVVWLLLASAALAWSMRSLRRHVETALEQRRSGADAGDAP